MTFTERSQFSFSQMNKTCPRPTGQKGFVFLCVLSFAYSIQQKTKQKKNESEYS